jgi:tetratricopeptide (TPR) repeat protein
VALHRHDDRTDDRGSVAWARSNLPLLERSVREAPNEPFHRFNLGGALHRLGLHAEAEKMLRRALERAPRRITWAPSAYAELARAVAAQGRPREAVGLARQATRLAPSWAAGWCMLAEARAAAGRPQKALEAYARALACGEGALLPGTVPDDTSWEVRRGIARIHFERGEYTAAADCLTRALALDPSSPELRVMLARSLESAGRPREAREQLERAVGSGHGGAEAYLAFGDFFARRAEEALLRGLVDNAESAPLLRRIERLREARATT